MTDPFTQRVDVKGPAHRRVATAGERTATTMVVAESFSATPPSLGLGAALALLGGGSEARSRMEMQLGFKWQPELLGNVQSATWRARNSDEPWFTMQPMLLCGDEGVGRTHVARRLAQLATLPHAVFDLSGDLGTGHFRRRPRGPDLILPPPPVLAMAVSRCANPLVTVMGVDEADADAQRNLARMIDPETAGRWVDHATGSVVDLRQVSWMVQSRDPASVIPQLRRLFVPVELTWPARGDVPLHMVEVLAEAAFDAGLSDRVGERVDEGLQQLDRIGSHRSTARLYARANAWLVESFR